MAEIHAARRGRAHDRVAEAGADAALITSGPNVRYLTGLASSNAALLLAADGTAVLATDSRYALAAERDCPDVELITERFIEPRLAAEMPARGLRTVAFEAHEMTVERHAALAAEAGGVTLIPFGRKIEELRTVKDPSELELLGTACRISCQAIADVFSLIRPGLTERQLAAALNARMADLRADRPADPPRRPDHDGFRRGVRRLPRGHDQDRGARRARGLAAGDLRAGRGGAAVRPGRRPAGRRRRRRGRGRPRPDPRRRAQRPFPARAGTRRGPRGARGADDRIRQNG